MRESYVEHRKELSSFWTSFKRNELNSISKLPDQITFKASILAKIALAGFIIGVGIFGGVSMIQNGSEMDGSILIVASMIFCVLLYFLGHREMDRVYTVNAEGIKIDKYLYKWSEIDDLHIKFRQGARANMVLICFNFYELKKEYQLDTMTKSTDEIAQILDLYQQLWRKNLKTENH